MRQRKQSITILLPNVPLCGMLPDDWMYYYEHWCDPFEGVEKDSCTLYVPKDSIEKYREKQFWSDFNYKLIIYATKALRHSHLNTLSINKLHSTNKSYRQYTPNDFMDTYKVLHSFRTRAIASFISMSVISLSIPNRSDLMSIVAFPLTFTVNDSIVLNIGIR